MDITKYELEELVAAYFECRLTRSEEADLRTVLLQSPYHSDTIDECRLLMGLEVIARKPARQQRRRIFHAPYLRAAASVALAIGVGAALYIHSSRPTAAQSVCIAYINGHEITDPEMARQIAEREQNESLALLRSIEHDIAATHEYYNNIINDIPKTSSL